MVELTHAAGRLPAHDEVPRTTDALSHILAVRAEARRTSEVFQQSIERLDDGVPPFPRAPFGRQLEQVARMVGGGLAVPVFKTQIGSFDTHANQPTRQAQLLTQLAEGLAAFRQAMIAIGRWDQVLVMSYSEFGRRARQNASGGTDHGTSAPQFVMGGSVKGGLHGAYPPLSDLEDGDLRHTVDFRNVFATLARDCWGQSYDFGLRQPQRLDLLA